MHMNLMLNQLKRSIELDPTEERFNTKLTLRKQKIASLLMKKRMNYKYSNQNQNENEFVQDNGSSFSIEAILKSHCMIIQNEIENQLLSSLVYIRKELNIIEHELIVLDFLKAYNTLQKILILLPKYLINESYVNEIIPILSETLILDPEVNKLLSQNNIITIILQLFNNNPLLSSNLLENIALLLMRYTNDKENSLRSEMNSSGIMIFFIKVLIDRPDMPLRNKKNILFFLNKRLIISIALNQSTQCLFIDYLFKEIHQYDLIYNGNTNLNLELQSNKAIIKLSLKLIQLCTNKNIPTYQYFNFIQGIQLLMNLLSYSNVIGKVSLELISSFASEIDPIYTTTLFDNCIIEHLCILLQKDTIDYNTKRNGIWIISNLSLSQDDADKFFEHKVIVNVLFDLFTQSFGDKELCENIFIALSYLTNTSLKENMDFLITKGYVIIASLFLSDEKLNEKCGMIALEGLVNITILLMRKNNNLLSHTIINEFNQANLIEKIERLAMNENKKKKLSFRAAGFLMLISNKMQESSIEL